MFKPFDKLQALAPVTLNTCVCLLNWRKLFNNHGAMIRIWKPDIDIYYCLIYRLYSKPTNLYLHPSERPSRPHWYHFLGLCFLHKSGPGNVWPIVLPQSCFLIQDPRLRMHSRFPVSLVFQFHSCFDTVQLVYIPGMQWEVLICVHILKLLTRKIDLYVTSHPFLLLCVLWTFKMDSPAVQLHYTLWSQ